MKRKEGPYLVGGDESAMAMPMGDGRCFSRAEVTLVGRLSDGWGTGLSSQVLEATLGTLGLNRGNILDKMCKKTRNT